MKNDSPRVISLVLLILEKAEGRICTNLMHQSKIKTEYLKQHPVVMERKEQFSIMCVLGREAKRVVVSC